MAEKPLHIPYGLKADGTRLPGEALTQLPKLELHGIRDTAFKRERDNLAAEYRCPLCLARIYPRAQTPIARAHWTHFGKSRPLCPLDVKRALNDDEVSAIVFEGRQEGEAHRQLRLALLGWAERDPDTDPLSCTSDEYLRPEEGTGCYPDVRFSHKGKWVVLEVQLAPASLTTIARRRLYYAKQNNRLLWVTSNFDPNIYITTSTWDIAADQRGVILSVDDEVKALIDTDNRLRFRAFSFRVALQEWTDEIVILSDIDFDESGTPSLKDKWAFEYKAKWIEIAGIEYQNCRNLLDDAILKAGLAPSDVYKEIIPERLAQIVNLLIALEMGKVVGSAHANLYGLIGSAITHKEGKRAGNLIIRALERYQPELKNWPVVRKVLNDENNQETQWGRTSFLGKLRNVLFPGWTLP